MESPATRFLIGKMPNIPHMDEFYNIRIDSKEFIMDKKHLELLRQEIDKVLAQKTPK